jgi:hypothetical protein
VFYKYTELRSKCEQIACHTGSLSAFPEKLVANNEDSTQIKHQINPARLLLLRRRTTLFVKEKPLYFVRERQWQSSSRSQLILGQTDVAYDAIETGCIGT